MANLPAISNKIFNPSFSVQNLKNRSYIIGTFADA